MALTRITQTDLTGKGVVGLPDTPGLSTTEMQEKLDEIANDVLVPKHNALVDDLESNSAAKNIGAKSVQGTDSNIQDELDNRYTQSVINQLLGNKVDKEVGKGLTTNDFTDGFRTKLNGIEDRANHYVLPAGTQDTLGGVMGDGTTFTIDENGVGHSIGGGGGTADYNALVHKPVVNGVTVSGNKASEAYGLLRPYLVITTEAGSTVTISKGGVTITATQKAGSTTEWEVYPTSYGTWTVNSDLPGADIASTTITIDAVKMYSITVNHITATITVDYQVGATCVCRKGSTVYTATTNPQTFTVRSLGTWTIETEYDGITKSVAVPISSDGQTESVSIGYATINITYGNAFRGTTITCTNGDTVYSKTAPSDGNILSFTIPTTGTWLVSGTVGEDTYTQSVVVSSMTIYSIALNVFNATITVTFPYSNGASCTISDGTTTLTADSSPMAFSIPNTGTWTATCTLDGVSKTDSKVITTDGQTESIEFGYGTINVTYDNEFRGLSITCVNGTTTITKTAPISGNTMAYYPPSTGEWIISSTYSGTPYQVTATITSLSIAVSAQLQMIPDGDTVTPTDDIQKWLNCAGIFDKVSYTALSDILSDSVTFNALLGDNNACKYMARSTTWASTLCADQYAMTMIGQYDVCCDALLNDNTWYAALAASAYASYVIGHVDSGEYIHGANNEVAYYLDGATKIPISDPSTLDAGTYTFGSTVAKNPDSLATDYTKSIRITPNTVEVVLRPDNALYWWGYQSSNLETCSSSGGWSTSSSYSIVAPTYNANSISISSSSNTYCFVGTTSTLSPTKVKAVITGVRLDGSSTPMYGSMFMTNKNLYSSEEDVITHRTSAMAYYEKSITHSNMYFACGSYVNGQENIHALWYE